MFECGTHDEKGQRKKGNNKNKQKGPEHFHVTWTATQVQYVYAPTTAFRTGDPTSTVLGQILGPSPGLPSHISPLCLFGKKKQVPCVYFSIISKNLLNEVVILENLAK